jgi:hypothetical protein
MNVGDDSISPVQAIEMLVGRGAQGRNRTTDTAIFSRMLYQLSYLGPLALGFADAGL